ncbi:MAG TPA: L-erythro-3,5-diaminohexanoate dehydrogenase [Candidatus Acidoferrales bacterium]|nr:L-erythro-3,5-diaminohexanoate dehydrogenase [Candidatus Acidoferrales bacterium]
MSITSGRAHPLGIHRVIDPPGAMPQTAWKLDNDPTPYEGELLCDVDVLNIDSASFKQIADACAGDAARIAEHVLGIVRERGKMHNPVTGSGGMFIGRARTTGMRIASLVSLTLTPLRVDAIERVCVSTGRIWVRGTAVLFASGLWAELPDDIDENVALAVLDVAGAPAQVQRLCAPGQTVVIVGADGKSGMLACAQAKKCVGRSGRVIGVAPSDATPSAVLLNRHGYVDAFVACDACNTLEVAERIAAIAPQLADVTINCVNVPNTELASILCTKDGGTVYFFSMSTSFSAAALGAEGVGKDVTMIVGNGYARGHAQTALQTLRDHPPIHTYFNDRYAAKEDLA